MDVRRFRPAGLLEERFGGMGPMAGAQPMLPSRLTRDRGRGDPMQEWAQQRYNRERQLGADTGWMGLSPSLNYRLQQPASEGPIGIEDYVESKTEEIPPTPPISLMPELNPGIREVSNAPQPPTRPPGLLQSDQARLRDLLDSIGLGQ